MDLPDLSPLARPGAEIEVHVTPRAARNALSVEGGRIRIRVTAVPEAGKATEAARRLLAEALGVAHTRLALVRGAAAREKVFRLS